jgi:hypothetical protein
VKVSGEDESGDDSGGRIGVNSGAGKSPEASKTGLFAAKHGVLWQIMAFHE